LEIEEIQPFCIGAKQDCGQQEFIFPQPEGEYGHDNASLTKIAKSVCRKKRMTASGSWRKQNPRDVPASVQKGEMYLINCK
jgi:hypothetical protein